MVGREIVVPRRQDWLVLLGLLALWFEVAGIGGWVAASSVASWYPSLAKPGFTPPDRVFGPV